MATMKKITAVLLTAVLLLSGCSGGDTTWVFEHDGERMPAGLYISLMMSALAEVEDYQAELNSTDPSYVTPKIKELVKTQMEGTEAGEWAQNRARELAQQYFWVEKEFEARGLELTSDEQDYITSNVTALWGDYGENYEANGIAQSSMELLQSYNIKMSKVFEDMYTGDGEFAVPDSELKTYFQANYAKVDYMLLPLATLDETNEEGEVLRTTDEINAETIESAQQYVEMLEKGTSIEEVIFQRDLGDLNTSGGEGSAEMPEAGSYTLMLTDSDEMKAYYGETLLNAAFAAKVGQPEIVEDANYYWLITRRDVLQDAEDFGTYRSVLVTALKEEEFRDYMEEQAAELQFSAENTASIGRYLPRNIKDL